MSFEIDSYDHFVIVSSLTVLSVTGNRLFQLGETTSIGCVTPVPVQSIQWMNESSNMVVISGTSTTQLELNILISALSNNAQYTCIVSDGGGFLESETINIGFRSTYYIIIARKVLIMAG